MEGEHNGDRDLFFAKYDSDGEQLWLIQYGSDAADVCEEVAFDRANECFYAVGLTMGSLVDDSAGTQDAWVIQFDSDGNWLWGQQIGSVGHDGANNYFNGYFDEIRISKGVARWWSNFTPPSSPYDHTCSASSSSSSSSS